MKKISLGWSVVSADPEDTHVIETGKPYGAKVFATRGIAQRVATLSRYVQYSYKGEYKLVEVFCEVEG